MTFVCPPDHKHGATHTCYMGHGCRCESCREGYSSSRSRSRLGVVRRNVRPCGCSSAGMCSFHVDAALAIWRAER